MRAALLSAIGIAGLGSVSAAHVQSAPASRPAPLAPGNLDVRWIHGAADCSSNADPPIQVHRYDEDTWILRQNKCVHYEAPFLYLLLGTRRAFLQDTGATPSPEKFPLRDTVDRLLEEWGKSRGIDSLELV
ncbi:MAG: hypothetical protein ACREIU_16190, partial [Planctomycetota bacterium]